MRLLLNLIWLVLCGFCMAVGYVLAGIVACVLIVDSDTYLPSRV